MDDVPPDEILLPDDEGRFQVIVYPDCIPWIQDLGSLSIHGRTLVGRYRVTMLENSRAEEVGLLLTPAEDD